MLATARFVLVQSGPKEPTHEGLQAPLAAGAIRWHAVSCAGRQLHAGSFASQCVASSSHVGGTTCQIARRGPSKAPSLQQACCWACGVMHGLLGAHQRTRFYMKPWRACPRSPPSAPVPQMRKGLDTTRIIAAALGATEGLARTWS
jgi:hypothetical protein